MARETEKWRGVSMVTAGSAFSTDGNLVAPNSAGRLLKWLSVPVLGKYNTVPVVAVQVMTAQGRERPATAFCPGTVCVGAIPGLTQIWEVGSGEGKSNLNNPNNLNNIKIWSPDPWSSSELGQSPCTRDIPGMPLIPVPPAHLVHVEEG